VGSPHARPARTNSRCLLVLRAPSAWRPSAVPRSPDRVVDAVHCAISVIAALARITGAPAPSLDERDVRCRGGEGELQAADGSAAGPTRVRHLLVPGPRASAALGAGVIRKGRNYRSRALATGALIAAKAIDAVDGDLGAILVSVLEVRRDLGDAAWRSQFPPRTPVVVDLFHVRSVPATANAELSVLVDETVRARVTVTLEMEFGLADLQAEIHGGWLTGLTGRQQVSASLKVDALRIGLGPVTAVGHTLVETGRSTGWQSVRLPYPVPLVGGRR
jgi:hypothetical protein